MAPDLDLIEGLPENRYYRAAVIIALIVSILLAAIVGLDALVRTGA